MAKKKKKTEKAAKPKNSENAKPRKGKHEKWLTEEGVALIRGWARDGLTDEDIAKNMGIARSTLNTWKEKYEPIAGAIRCGKDVADRIVENALFQKATGSKIIITKPMKVKDVRYENGKRIETEHIEYVDEEVYTPPDTMAQMYWLNNRKPQTWRQKPKEEIETSGITIVFNDPEAEEWAR